MTQQVSITIPAIDALATLTLIEAVGYRQIKDSFYDAYFDNMEKQILSQIPDQAYPEIAREALEKLKRNR